MAVGGRETRGAEQLHAARGVTAHWDRIAVTRTAASSAAPGTTRLLLPLRPGVLVVAVSRGLRVDVREGKEKRD